MTKYARQTPWCNIFLGALTLGMLAGGRAWGQEKPNLDETLWREPVLGRTFAPDLLGDRMVAVAGVDNIRAVGAPVPEPAGVLAVAAAAGAAGPLLRLRRRPRAAAGA